MEGISGGSMLKGMKEYWKKRGYRYERLNGSGQGGRRRKKRVQELGSKRRRRLWRIKISPKIRFLRNIPSPKKLLLWLRDAYVRMMMGLANSRAMTMNVGAAVGYGGSVAAGDAALSGFGRVPVKEYDEKMIIQIYKSLMMGHAHAHHLVPGDIAAPSIASQIFSPR